MNLPSCSRTFGPPATAHRPPGSAGTAWRHFVHHIYMMSFLLSMGFRSLSGQTDPEPTSPDPLTPGRHNTTPISACAGYNPPLLTFTTPPSGGSPPYYYHWQLNLTLLPGETLPALDPPQLTSPGTYSYRCQITDSYGSVVYTDEKTYTIVPDPVAHLTGGGVFCQQDEVTLAVALSGGTGSFSLQWQVSDDNLLFSIIPNAGGSTYAPEPGTPGTLYYRVIILPAVGSCNNATSPTEPVTRIAQPVTSPIYHL